jgi:hypothetical protein
MTHIAIQEALNGKPVDIRVFPKPAVERTLAEVSKVPI